MKLIEKNINPEEQSSNSSNETTYNVVISHYLPNYSYFYTVEVIEKNEANSEISGKIEVFFSSKDFYKNRIDARLFFDSKYAEIDNESENQSYNHSTIICLYFSITDDKGNKENLLLSSTEMGDNFKNKAIEQDIFSSYSQFISPPKQDNTMPKNKFLDGLYSDF